MKVQDKTGQIASMGFHIFSLAPTGYKSQGRTQGGGVVGDKSPPLELDMLQKLYYLRKGNQMFSQTFCLSICRLMQTPQNKFACKFQGTL